MSEQEQHQPESSRLVIKAFVSGVVFMMACRLSGEFYTWWEHAPWTTASNETALMLSAPLTCLVFLVAIWVSQQISRYYFGYRSFAFSESRVPMKASGFLGFVLGAFVTQVFLSILASLL